MMCRCVLIFAIAVVCSTTSSIGQEFPPSQSVQIRTDCIACAWCSYSLWSPAPSFQKHYRKQPSFTKMTLTSSYPGRSQTTSRPLITFISTTIRSCTTTAVPPNMYLHRTVTWRWMAVRTPTLFPNRESCIRATWDPCWCMCMDMRVVTGGILQH